MAELINSGVISITAEFFSSGSDIYGRVVQPHPKLGVYPHQSMVLEELEPLLAKVRVASGSSASADVEPVTPRTTPVKKGQMIGVGNRDDPEIGKIPTSVTVHGVANSLPKDSLCWKDLAYLNDDQLNRRILSIGREIGADKAVAKIQSGANLNTTQGATLYKWWCNATTDQRFLLITNAKKIGKVTDNDKTAFLARLGVGQYPFRGTDRKMEECEEESEEEFEEGLALEFEALSTN